MHRVHWKKKKRKRKLAHSCTVDHLVVSTSVFAHINILAVPSSSDTSANSSWSKIHKLMPAQKWAGSYYGIAGAGAVPGTPHTSPGPEADPLRWSPSSGVRGTLHTAGAWAAAAASGRWPDRRSPGRSPRWCQPWWTVWSTGWGAAEDHPPWWRTRGTAWQWGATTGATSSARFPHPRSSQAADQPDWRSARSAANNKHVNQETHTHTHMQVYSIWQVL